MPPWSRPSRRWLAPGRSPPSGDGGGSPSPLTNQQTPPPGTPLVSDQHFHYNLTRAGQVPITETGSQELTWTTSDLRQLDGTGRYMHPGRLQYGRQLPWLTTRPLHATASGDNTATRQWCLARSRGRLPMPGGPGADLELTWS